MTNLLVGFSTIPPVSSFEWLLLPSHCTDLPKGIQRLAIPALPGTRMVNMHSAAPQVAPVAMLPMRAHRELCSSP
jgi:hypothetical protein